MGIFKTSSAVLLTLSASLSAEFCLPLSIDLTASADSFRSLLKGAGTIITALMWALMWVCPFLNWNVMVLVRKWGEVGVGTTGMVGNPLLLAIPVQPNGAPDDRWTFLENHLLHRLEYGCCLRLDDQ